MTNFGNDDLELAKLFKEIDLEQQEPGFSNHENASFPPFSTIGSPQRCRMTKFRRDAQGEGRGGYHGLGESRITHTSTALPSAVEPHQGATPLEGGQQAVQQGELETVPTTCHMGPPITRTHSQLVSPSHTQSSVSSIRSSVSSGPSSHPGAAEVLKFWGGTIN